MSNAFALAVAAPLLLGLVCLAQFNSQPASRAPADPGDVGSVDAIVKAVYESISGPAGEPRQWERFHSLMHPDGARLMATQELEDGTEDLLVMTPADYVERVSDAFQQGGFFERELHRDEIRYGHVVHAWSTYAWAREEGAEPVQRGVNSYQLWFDDERWWVVSILWDSEREDQPIPARFLDSEG